MSTHFADRLLDACDRKGGPICVGIDPVYERLPQSVRGDESDDLHQRAQAIGRFVHGVLEAVAPHVPCVKFQAACFERYQWHGVEVCRNLMAQARGMGLIVINDAKRGDIGISSEHYAAACLADAELPGPDAMTINPYLGDDAIKPFIEHAAAHGKGLFALVRTSNPGSDALQSLKLTDNRCVADAVADMIAGLGQSPALIGQRGYSLLGAVVGATKPQDAARLRDRMLHQIFLVPGFGAQGATAQDIRPCFNPNATGALITASRSILYAHEKSPGDWQQAIAQAAQDMSRQVSIAIQ